jgi:hypothetical protein|nr:MAG TPA: hypothetical protein [Caudoviricetes sp.]
MPVKSAFNKKPLITLGIIALLLIGIIFINVSCSAKMDKPQTQTTTTPTVEQNKPTETKQEVVKEEVKQETGNTVVEEATTNSVEDVIKPYQLPVLDIKTKLGLTRDDKDNKIVSYFNTASKNGKFKRVMYYICSPKDTVLPTKGRYFMFDLGATETSHPIPISSINVGDNSYLVTDKTKVKEILNDLNTHNEFYLILENTQRINMFVEPRKTNTLPCM